MKVGPLAALAALAFMAGCEKPDNAPGPGGVTVGEAKALDQAAEMIESDAPPEVRLEPSRAATR